MKLATTIQQDGQGMRVAFDGQLVYENSLEGRLLLESLLGEHPTQLVVDLRQVSRLGSNWIAVFAWAQQQMLHWNGTLRLINCNTVIYSMLAACEVHHLLHAERVPVRPPDSSSIDPYLRGLIAVLREKGILTDADLQRILDGE